MKDTLFHSITTFCERHDLIPSGSTIIIGLSGGPDSVFLLHYLASMKEMLNLRLIAVHLDHEWRPDSHKDIDFCHQLALSLRIPFESRKLSELGLTLKFNGSKEEIGRNARRFLFETIKDEKNADFIALAHHAQDQQETFFIRLLRGASLSGLTSMKAKDGFYIRPLLQINKPDIIDYLQSNSIEYLVDPSNESAVYLRNRIRSKVLPALAESDARFNANFLNTLERLQETEQFLEDLAQKTFDQISVCNNDTCSVDYPKLLEISPILRYRVILAWLIANKVKFNPSQSFFDEIIRFMEFNGKKHQVHPDWLMVKEQSILHIKSIDNR
jgi:tRNA(Ile)-lysidine synthase